MTLPQLVAQACRCGEETKTDPASLCRRCTLLERTRELLETAFRFEGDALAHATDTETAEAIYLLLEAYEEAARRCVNLSARHAV